MYRAYSLNFSWALGLFAMSPTSSWQSSINNLRRLTGGSVDDSGDAGGAAISLVNRKLSPYNNDFVIPKQLLAQAQLQPSVDIKNFLSGNFSAPSVSSAVANANVLVGGDVATVTGESNNVLEAGIPISVNVIGIETANAFMSVFFVVLILAAIMMVALGLGYLALFAWSRSSRGTDASREAFAKYPTFARAWGLRGALVCVLPILIFTFYQWTLKDAWLPILLSVITLLALLACVLPPVFFVLRSILPLPSRWSGDDDSAPSHALAPLIASLRPERYYFIIPAMLAIIVKALVIAFGQDHGMVQAIVLLVLEFIFLGIIVVLRPHRTRGGDVLSAFLAVARIVCTGLTIAFAESLNLNAIPRVVVGIIIAVIYSVVVVFMFFNILWHLGGWRILHCFRPWRRRHAPSGSTTLGSNNHSQSSLEKGQQKSENGEKQPTLTITPAPSSHFYQRPTNPTPTHTPTTLSEFSPIPTTSHFSDVPTEFTETSMSSTLGETLPHRWSFHHSRPPSASAASHSVSTPSALSPTSPTESAYTTPRHSWQPPSPREEPPLAS